VTAIPADDEPPQLQEHKKRRTSAQARRAEAEDGHVTIEQCGVTLHVPVKGKVPLKAYMAFKAGDELGGTEALLGAEQWEAFLAKDPTVDDFTAIGDQLTELLGNR
jgi:hypothetical protein